jgi:hypothetical protein
MIPYIAVLILLIVMVLYQVYSDAESFTDASGNRIVVKDASGNRIVTKDASGNDIKMSLSDLFALLGPFKMSDASGNTIKAPGPATVKPTEASAKEIEDRIAKSVAKQVKDDLISQRAVDQVYDKYAPCDLTDAEAQGQDYEKQYPRSSMGLRNHQQPDMSEYIRKDSIPCWNCSIP